MAFVNVAGLLVLRSIDRRRELAALGARASDLIWQICLESGAIVALGMHDST